MLVCFIAETERITTLRHKYHPHLEPNRRYITSASGRYVHSNNYFGQQPPTTVAERRLQDIERMRRATPRLTSASKRGDFLIHPEWPPTFTAHRLNGLSSVDIPGTTAVR